ncbi:MAG: hypothetical protein AAGI38_23735 [Bacteroidota bacterium]
MEILSIIFEGIKYALPAVVVLLVVKLMNDAQLRREQMNHSMLIKNELLKKHLPLKVAAYERAVLFLERISPQNLVPRLNFHGKSASELKVEMLNEIRGEYEHNLAQQIYISNHAWASLTRAKEEMMAVVNLSARELPQEASGLDLGRKILEKCSALKEPPTQNATIMLKSDIQNLFRI